MLPFGPRLRVVLLSTAFATMALIPKLVMAQAIPPIPQLGIAWPGLPPDDLNRMHSAAARLYEGRSIGTIERWRNPDTKDAGEVELIRSFDMQGMPCRTIDYTIRYETNRNRLNHYTVNWCRVPGDDWKIIEIGRPP